MTVIIKRFAAAGGCVRVGGWFLWVPQASNAARLQPAHAAAQPLLLSTQSSIPPTVVEGVLRNRTLYEALSDCDIPAAEILPSRDPSNRCSISAHRGPWMHFRSVLTTRT